MSIGSRAAGLALAALGVVTGVAPTASAQSAEQNAEQNKVLFAVVVNQVYNRGDLALIDDLIAKDVTDNGSPLGRDGFKAMIRDLHQKSPSYRANVADVVTDGDRVIGVVAQSGAADGVASKILILRIANGQVTEQWTMPDNPGLRKQLGLGAGTTGQAATAN
jgi:predicted ester cyclase